MKLGADDLDRLAAAWAPAGSPIVVFNKSHSGSRLLARLLIDSGVYMGGDRNDSEDSADFLRLVEPVVERWAPDFAKLMRLGDPQLPALVDSVFAHHLLARPSGARWGWKLCETLYVLPVIYRLFPNAWFVHLIRDGRDVAFSDHVAPVKPFWRKVYFDTDRIETWLGRSLTHRSYRREPHIFNARHWVSSVETGRRYGSMIGARYIEVRYEDLVLRPEATARGLLAQLDIVADNEVIAKFAASVNHDGLGRHRVAPARQLRSALRVLRPTLVAFDYDEDPETPAWDWRAWVGGRGSRRA